MQQNAKRRESLTGKRRFRKIRNVATSRKLEMWGRQRAAGALEKKKVQARYTKSSRGQVPLVFALGVHSNGAQQNRSRGSVVLGEIISRHAESVPPTYEILLGCWLGTNFLRSDTNSGMLLPGGVVPVLTATTCHKMSPGSDTDRNLTALLAFTLLDQEAPRNGNLRVIRSAHLSRWGRSLHLESCASCVMAFWVPCTFPEHHPAEASAEISAKRAHSAQSLFRNSQWASKR